MSDYYDDEYVEFADEDESDEQGFIAAARRPHG